MSTATKDSLIRLLQAAYSGELAAFYAYEGHRHSVRDKTEKEEIRKIQLEERDHRECLGEFLSDLGAKPDPWREFKFTVIGRTIGLLCYIGGWFIPMYGAGKLERGNIVEYENAARMAAWAGYDEMVDALLIMAEVEWDHELYFRRKSESHWLKSIFRIWCPPPPRDNIRTSFYAEFPALAPGEGEASV
jgi:hypothetical protein